VLPYGDPGCSSVVDTFASVFGGVNPNGIRSRYVFQPHGAESAWLPDFEKHVVIAVRVKRRVEIDQVNRLILDVVPEDLQIVAVVKGVHGKREEILHVSPNGGNY
jgi:hypothetical protein